METLLGMQCISPGARTASPCACCAYYVRTYMYKHGCTLDARITVCCCAQEVSLEKIDVGKMISAIGGSGERYWLCVHSPGQRFCRVLLCLKGTPVLSLLNTYSACHSLGSLQDCYAVCRVGPLYDRHFGN